MKFSTLPIRRLSALAGMLLAAPASAVVNIDYVPVGNAGNAADTRVMSDSTTGYGGVAYAYQIAKNETTIGQYAEFLNAVAKTDAYGLYSANMSSTGSYTYVAGINRSGSSGSYTYSVVAGSGNKPITFVSWFDAARFCNWLQNGQQTGAGAAISAETGAYTLNGATSGIILKNAGATVWIPSEDEWYKAAYYDPNKGGAGVGGYWVQATQSDTLSGNTVGTPYSANYWDGDYVGSGNASFPTANALTDTGAYGMNSDSAYGTNDQGGNVWEWHDAVVSGLWRGLRGGSWIHAAGSLNYMGRPNEVPTYEHYTLGFRVATLARVSLTTNALNGTVTGAGDYLMGSTATITATASPGYVFVGWTGDASGATNPLDFLMDGNKTVTANFTLLLTRIIGVSGNLAFGDVTMGQTTTATMTIANSGNRALTVTGISYPAGFSGAWSGTIAAGGSRSVTVTFSPVAAEAYSGTVTVNSNMTSGTNTLAASGTGTLPPPYLEVEQPAYSPVASGDSRDYGNCIVGAPSALTFTIRNTGLGTLTGIGITFAGPAAADFSLITALATELPAGESTTFDVWFAPATGGLKAALLQFTSNDPTQAVFEVSLGGRAFSTADDTDTDGMNDAAEFKLSALGFDWQVSQPELVTTYFANTSQNGLVTREQVKAPHAGYPLLSKDPVSGLFKLTLGIRKSTDLQQFDPFPMTAPQAVINAQGALEFPFSPSGSSAFFRLEVK